MHLYYTAILPLVLITSTLFAETYEEWATQLKAATGRHEVHRLKAQLANAAIQRLETEELPKTAAKKLRAEILAHCADVQLGAMDVWYGDSVVTWSRLKLLDDEWSEARSILWNQAEVLENIEKNLAANKIPVSSISPVAGCRYHLGETYRMEYEQSDELAPAVEALKHFYNVYIKYGDSPWGEPAKDKADAAKTFVEGKGRRVRIELGPHRETFAANKFRLGARLVADGSYEEAIAPLCDALNFFPEAGKSAAALRNLGIGYLNLEMHDEALMTAEYLCERFGTDTNAAPALLGIGRRYIDQGEEQRGEQVFDLYLTSFPTDAHRADILSYFAWKAYKAEHWQSADRYFAQIVELNRSVKAQRARADCAMKLEDPVSATAHFQALENLLREQGASGEGLEKAVYFQAHCSKQPEAYDRFIAEFPESELVPRVMGEQAQVLLVAGNFDAAFQVLEQLVGKYPDAPAARTALAGLIVAAVDAGRFDIAGRVLDHMLEDRKAYGYDVYIPTGEGLASAGQYELAVKAFSAVPLNAKRKYVERALFGIGSAFFGMELFEESFQSLEKLLTKYPTSGFFRDARLLQARALVRLDRYDHAAEAYGDVMALGQDYAVTLELAQILNDPEAKLAAYQRIALLADPDRMEHRPMIADSIIASLPLCLELRKYELALSTCDQFVEMFPEHDQLPTIGKYRKEAEHAMVQ